MAIRAETISSLLQTLFKDYEETRATKRKEYETGKGILESVVKQFGPGYLKGEERKMLASMEQGMVGRGLGGTTVPAAAGMGIKADIRDRATKARTGAMTDVARYMAGFQDLTPTPGTLAHLATGGFSGMLQEKQQALQQEQFAALQPTKRYGEGSFAKSGLLYPEQGAAGRLGADSSTPGSVRTTSMPSVTGAGAATYGVSGGMDSSSVSMGDPIWGASEQWRSEQPSWVNPGGSRPEGFAAAPGGGDIFVGGGGGKFRGKGATGSW